MSYTRCPVAMLFLSGVTGRGRWDGWRGCSGRVKGGDRASSRFAGALAPRFNTFWKKEVEEESGQRRGADDQETALPRIESGGANGDLSNEIQIGRPCNRAMKGSRWRSATRSDRRRGPPARCAAADRTS